MKQKELYTINKMKTELKQEALIFGKEVSQEKIDKITFSITRRDQNLLQRKWSRYVSKITMKMVGIEKKHLI